MKAEHLGRARRALKACCPGLALFLCLLSMQPASASHDDYIRGYAEALMREKLNIAAYSLDVREGRIELELDHVHKAMHDEVVRALSAISGVSDVSISYTGEEPPFAREGAPSGPEGTGRSILSSLFEHRRLFQPLLADPRWPHFSISYQRYEGDSELENVGATSFGETLPLYSGGDPGSGEWLVGIQAAVFAVFDLDAESLDLINADYWVGIPLTYRNHAFSSLLRVFHQSSHLGDEFLLRSRIDRVNLSYEAVNLTASYELLEWVRLYGGGSYIFHKEPPDLKSWSAQYGFELKSPSTYLRGSVIPVFGADFKSREEHGWGTDISLRAGLQIASEKLVWNKLYFMLEYFNGHSPNGQFYDRYIEYLSLATHFYFQ